MEEDQINTNSNRDESEIKDGDLLNIANNILFLLNHSQRLENEEDLFLDDFYVSIIGNLLSENQPELTPGNTLQEKAEIMDKLVQSLSKAIEVDLPQINGSGIILNHDKESAKNLLDVILELIKTIIDNNLEEVEEDKNENISDKKKINNNKNNYNIDDSNNELNKNIEEYQIDENDDLDKNNNKEYKIKEQNYDNKIIDDDINENININNEYNNNNQKSDEKNIKQSQSSSFQNINSSCFEPLHFQKMMKKIKDKENNIKNSYSRKTYSQNDLSRYERNREDIEINQEENDEENDLNINLSNLSELKKEKNKKNEIITSDKKSSNKEEEKLEQEDLDIDMNYSENRTTNSMPQGYVKMNLEESEENKENNNLNNNKKSVSILDDSHLIKGSKSNKFNEEEEIEQEEDINNLDNNLDNIKYSLQKKSEEKNKETNKKKEEKSSEKNISKNDEKKENEEENKEEKSKTNTNKNNSEENMELFDENIKYEIMKEFRKIYGDKLDYIFLKYNSQFSQNIIELALRNIKLAKEKMLKLGTNIPSKEDPEIIEFLQKYEKEFEYMLLNYSKEQKYQDIIKQKRINNYNNKIKKNQKIEEINNIKIEKEIQRRQKAKEMKNLHNRIKIGNKIFKEALEQEKQKNLENIKLKKEIINDENEEKRKAMIAIEKYYKDQIKILKEILAKEKKERDMEHRAYMIYLNQKEREQREEYKKQLNEIFEKFEEEERIQEYEDNNNPEIKRIFDAYYGS